MHTTGVLKKNGSERESNRPQVELLEYGDYECPYCRKAFEVVKELQEEFGESMSFSFKNFPLVDLHPHALLAAEAAECAGAQGKFDLMHDELYENQQNLSGELVEEIATNIGLNQKQFSHDLTNHVYRKKVEADLNQGIAEGVEHTPTFFINGRLFDEQWTLETLRAGLRAELKKEKNNE